MESKERDDINIHFRKDLQIDSKEKMEIATALATAILKEEFNDENNIYILDVPEKGNLSKNHATSFNRSKN